MLPLDHRELCVFGYLIVNVVRVHSQIYAAVETCHDFQATQEFCMDHVPGGAWRRIVLVFNKYLHHQTRPDILLHQLLFRDMRINLVD